jgi:hypothetical protein
MSEKAEIKRDGAKAQKNSGRGKIQKGDAIWNGFLVDYKEYPKGFALNKDVWAKVCTDASKSGRSLSPALKVILGEGNEKVRLGVIEWSVLEQLLDAEDRYQELYDTYMAFLAEDV